ncbi:hypothetical protein SLEP1_g10106 [Rubroshorea leprosula]|uniref:Uncharacterized protein n=1 Tax=Rubroshorea leprosula TaxID=152421 RepID=A0AAV5IBK8_9ROSI|nr:hypothetical protein SLEP1_g10106 [Rubroshorea leprosula]
MNPEHAWVGSSWVLRKPKMNPAHEAGLATNPACAWVRHKPKQFCERDAVSPVFCVPVFSGSTTLRPKATPPFSSPSFLVALASSPSFPPFQNLSVLVAVETILLGGTFWPLPELTVSPLASNETSEATWTDTRKLQEIMNLNLNFRFTNLRSKVSPKQKMEEEFKKPLPSDLDLCLTPTFIAKEVTDGRHPDTPSGVTACLDSGFGAKLKGGFYVDPEAKLLFLELFV